MTFVADFTPEQLQNASAGRRYGQRKRQRADELTTAVRDYLEWGAMTGSDRDYFERRFRTLLEGSK